MPDLSLSAEGRDQARSLADALADHPLAAVVSSPTQRAVETATPIAERVGKTVVLDGGFEEIDFGTWTAQPFEVLQPDPAWVAWNTRRSLARCPGGETMFQAQSRALASITRLAAIMPTAEIAVISHQDILKSIVAHVLGLSLDHLDRIALDPASRTTLTLSGPYAQITVLNLPPPQTLPAKP